MKHQDHPFYQQALAAQKENLIWLRYFAGMSQADLAEASDSSGNMIGQYESGQTLAQPNTLKAIAKALDCKIEDIIVSRKEGYRTRSISSSPVEQ